MFFLKYPEHIQIIHPMHRLTSGDLPYIPSDYDEIAEKCGCSWLPHYGINPKNRRLLIKYVCDEHWIDDIDSKVYSGVFRLELD